LNADNGLAYQNLGLCYQKKGDNFKAKENFDIAKKLSGY
jgi:hypothetical protein